MLTGSKRNRLWDLAGVVAFVLFGALLFVAPSCLKRIVPEGPVFNLPAGPEFDQAGYNLILEYEVGGGEQYYSRYLAHPTWPGFASGVTIGIGYDCGYNSSEVINSDWRELPRSDRSRLMETSGVTGHRAKSLIPAVSDISITWKTSEGVFQDVTLARFWQLTQRAFPGVESLCPEAQWACMSVVFNRGSAMTGKRRLEMREMRDAIEKQDYASLAKANRASMRCWAGTDIERGMHRRRFAEAELMEKCL